MLGRHAGRRIGLRWLAGGAGLAVAGAAVLAMAPAQASTAKVDAQLSLSGVATSANVLGGTTIGIHPGDIVDFKASPLPTAGLDNIPALGPVLNQLLGSLLGSQFQVVVSLPASFPGGARTITLGGPAKGVCAGAKDLPVTFPDAGTYPFTWTVQYVLPGLLGCSATSPNNTNLNLLRSAGIALNATNQWTGQIVVSDNPPKGGLSVQLPGLGAAPSLPVVGQLPTLSLPPVNLPTIPISIPDLTGGLPSVPGLSGKTSSAATSAATTATYDAVPTTIPDLVVPHGSGGGSGGGGLGLGSLTHVLPTAGLAGNADMAGAATSALPELPAVQPVAQQLTAVPSADPQPSSQPAPQASPSQTTTLAANPAPSAQMPVLLAIVAIIALSLVTATYARLYLLRRS
jgi:hypothetical protein